MKIAINLDKHFYSELKRLASDAKRPASSLIKEFLREGLFRRRPSSKSRKRKTPFELITFGGEGVLPGIDINKLR